jgi:hypothetical protein
MRQVHNYKNVQWLCHGTLIKALMRRVYMIDYLVSSIYTDMLSFLSPNSVTKENN